MVSVVGLSRQQWPKAETPVLTLALSTQIPCYGLDTDVPQKGSGADGPQMLGGGTLVPSVESQLDVFVWRWQSFSEVVHSE